MEEILQKFESVAVKSGYECKSNLYKNWGKFSNQEERRRDILESQKKNRSDKVDKSRGILDLVKAAENTKVFQSKTHYVPGLYVAGFMRSCNTYKDVLMLSEWMVEKPVDFHENWFVVPCPKGQRVLVVGNQGVTKTFTKYGQFRFQNYTALPGGNPIDYKGNNRYCVLDCIYDKTNLMMYILDLLAWNNLPMTDGETEFRNYWLNMHIREIPELKENNKKNQMKFSLLPKVLCNRESFNEFMMKSSHFENHQTTLDGLLFYHKQGHYLPGVTPLVGWLYPFMVPEILGSDITVNTAYILEKPADYVNQADFIEKFESKAELKIMKQKKRKSKVCAMETVETINKTDENLEANGPSDSNEVEVLAGDEMEATDEIPDEEPDKCDEVK